MRLTTFGKIFVAGFSLFIVGVLYLVFLKPTDTGPDYTLPAKLGFTQEEIAKSSKLEKAFKQEAIKAVSYCNFFSGYRPNRGKPIRFDAYIPGNYSKSIYYYEDPKTGEQTIPAYFITPGGGGLALAKSFAEEDYQRLPSCVLTPDLGGSGGIIMLSFPKGRVPQGQYIRAYGALWWDSINLNPGQIETEEGATSAPAPVVKIATYDRLTTSQASDPANVTFPLNIAVQRGPGVIRLNRLEFADNETRVWVELINLTPRSLEQWRGASEACIRPAGDACITAGTFGGEGDSPDDGENQVANDDTLSPDAPIPPAAAGASLSGYLTFSRLDPGQDLRLELPDFSDSGDETTAPIVVQLPNEKTARSAETSGSTERLAEGK
jgi:hypothetical protein